MIDVGAIVLLRYVARYGRDRFRLARVLELVQGRDGLVRTVVVGLRNQRRGAREPATENRAGLTVLRTAVQRLVMVLPGSDQPAQVVEDVKKWYQQLARREGAGVAQPRLRMELEVDEMRDLGAAQVVTPRVQQPK